MGSDADRSIDTYTQSLLPQHTTHHLAIASAPELADGQLMAVGRFADEERRWSVVWKEW